LRWARIGYAIGSFIAVSVFQFAATLVGRRRSLRVPLTFAWTFSILVASIGGLTSVLIPAVKRFAWGFYPAGRYFGGITVVGFSAMIIASIYLFWVAYRGAEGKGRERAGALLLAFVLGSFGMIDYLPAGGVDLQPIGFAAALAFVIVAATAVWRFELADITPEYAAAQILETMKSAVIVSDMDGSIRVANNAAGRLLGRDPNGLRLRDVLDRDEDLTTGKLINSRGLVEQPMAWRNAEGLTVDVLATSSFLRDDHGVPVGVVYVANDYTERKRAEIALRRSEERFRLLFERNLAGVYRTSVSGGIVDVNDACARIFGYESKERLLATTAHEFYFDPEERARVIQRLRDQKHLSNLEQRLRRRDGSEVWVLENMSLLDDDIIEGTLIDITDRKISQEQLEYQAYHDALTDLPNRLLFRDRIEIALAHARRSKRLSAVMFLDLDQFKHVNDTLGHTAGDRLLQAIAGRLVSCVRAEDTVARMGGDEFTILLADIADRTGASAVAEKVLDAVREPVMVDDHELFVSTSIGIALFPEDGEDAESLLKSADRAMYRAKELGRNNYQYTGPRLEIPRLDRLRLTSE
jgi:diguanylate cyclase (GGDEF)-like protein/PAS domain S-box-containing protein